MSGAPSTPAPRGDGWAVQFGVTSGGFLLRDGLLLLEKRPDTALLAPGAWDTPGGKARPGETAEDTLRRELAEELGIEVLACRLVAVLPESVAPRGEIAMPSEWLHHHFLVESWRGEVTAREGQMLEWQAVRDALALPKLFPLTAEALRLLLASPPRPRAP